MPAPTINNNIYGATSVETQQQEASVLVFFVPPAASGSSFSFSISAVGEANLGTITTDNPNLTVSDTTVTVEDGFNGTGRVTIHLSGATVPFTFFTITRTSGSAQAGTQTRLDVSTFGWFRVTELGTGASFNALAFAVTGLPSDQSVQVFLPCPLFLIPSVTGTDYSFTVGNTPSVTNVCIASVGSGLTSSGNTVTATSGLTVGMRSFVTITYTPAGETQSTTTRFAIQRLSAAGTGTAGNIQVGNLGFILIPSLPAGVYVRGNNVSYQSTEAGDYNFNFLCVGEVTFSTPAVTFTPPLNGSPFDQSASETSATVTVRNDGSLQTTEFNLQTNLGIIDPQIVNNPDDDY